jgi:2-polyprenyl-3-methyl-5-hydroxy-6-metoxy-1,4-benzoquinol methylase
MGEGNLTHRLLVGPAMERLLQLRRGERVLDVACGNGQFARRMAELGARVLAVDQSERMLSHARRRSRRFRNRVVYRSLDAADPRALRSLEPGAFDAVVCTMALMDIREVRPLARALTRLLTARGRFVFSVTHPCFNGTGIRRVLEEEDREGVMVDRAGVYVYRYGTPAASKGLAMVGQPVAQYLFDRSLSDLFRPFFDAGLILDGLEEPRFPPSVPPNRPLSWISVPEIPPVLVARFRS